MIYLFVTTAPGAWLDRAHEEPRVQPWIAHFETDHHLRPRLHRHLHLHGSSMVALTTSVGVAQLVHAVVRRDRQAFVGPDLFARPAQHRRHRPLHDDRSASTAPAPPVPRSSSMALVPAPWRCCSGWWSLSLIGILIASRPCASEGYSSPSSPSPRPSPSRPSSSRNRGIVGPGRSATTPVAPPVVLRARRPGRSTPDEQPDRWQIQLFALVFLVVLMLPLENLRAHDRSSAPGRAANERAAAAAGMNVARTKLLGFAISSAISPAWPASCRLQVSRR